MKKPTKNEKQGINERPHHDAVTAEEERRPPRPKPKPAVKWEGSDDPYYDDTEAPQVGCTVL